MSQPPPGSTIAPTSYFAEVAHGSRPEQDVVRRFITEVLSGGRLDRVDELLAPKYVNRAFGVDLPAFKEMPERRFDVEELIAEADAVVARFTCEMRGPGRKTTSFRGLTY